MSTDLKITWTMPTQTMLAEITEPSSKREDIALTYAMAITGDQDKSWVVPVNQAIIARWSKSGLQWIKKRAWKLIDRKALIAETVGYEVSNLGRVRSFVRSPTPKMLSLRSDAMGYFAVRLRGRNRKIHLLVAEAFIGPRPAGLDINHKNGIKADNRVENLEYVTRRENVLHSYRLGLQQRLIGEKNGRTRLSMEQVIAIRAACVSGISVDRVARRFSVSSGHIRKIRRGFARALV